MNYGTNNPSSSTAAATKHRRRHALKRVALALLLTALPIITTLWLTHTTSGLAALLHLAQVAIGGRISTQGLAGSVSAGFAVQRLDWQTHDTEVQWHALEVGPITWQLNRDAARTLTLHVSRLQARELRVVLPPSSGPRPQPTRLALPLTVQLAQAQISQLSFLDHQAPLTHIELRLTWGADLELKQLQAQWGGHALNASGRMAGQRPFALEVGGTLVSRVQEQHPPVQLTWRATGSLEQLALFAGATGGPDQAARGGLRAQLLPFSPLPLQALSAELEGIDPSAWWRRAPHAQLTIKADLTASDQAAFALTGPLHLTNAAPGPISRKRLPLSELRATLNVDTQTIALTQLDAELGQGRVTGSLRMHERHWQTELRLDGVDLSQLHERIRPLVVQGSVKAADAQNAVQVQADLSARGQVPGQLKLDFVINDRQLNLEHARLQLGSGSVQLQGRWAFTEAQAFAATGVVSNLDPTQFLHLPRGLGANGLNGTLSVVGQLQPQPQAQVALKLTDSASLGHGDIQLNIEPDQRLRVDAALALRHARLSARGTLSGADPQQSVLVTLDAPDLSELHAAVRGQLKAQARLSGAWHAPAIEARASANDLHYHQQRVHALTTQLSYSGGTDGALALTVEAQGHQHPAGAALSLAQATVSAQGTPHRLRVDVAATTARDLTLVARATGERKTALAWLGTLDALQLRGPISADLQHPAALRLGAGAALVGPLSLSVNDGFIREATVQVRDGQWESRGEFENLTMSASANAGEAPLTLRGEWSVRSAQVLDGALRIERVAGDVHGGPATGRVHMGLTALELHAKVRANHLSVSAAVRGTQVGTLSAQLTAQMEADAVSGWRLAPTRPWSGEVSATLPTLQWINPFLSINLRDNIRVAGTADFKLQLAGTPQTPLAHGHLSADALRLAWVEQGLRLDNGRLRARLEPHAPGGTQLIVDELRFSGAPRLRPKDARIQAALKDIDEGTLSASGQVRLPEFEGLLLVRSDKFPLLQRPDRWAMATGGAHIVFTPKQISIQGAARLDAGYIDITRRQAPALSSDVTIVRSDAPAAQPRSSAPRIALDFSVGIDLGPAFIVHGAGLDTRVEGALQLKHAGGGQVRATGALQAHDGVYEGYGQKLKIERGRLNFQGPVDNPELDVLALRTGLPVEVGLTLTRSAAAPVVRLHSDPPMTDIETLSWLVLGRPADDTRSDNAALARAALGLLGGSGEGIPTQLARRLGLDELSIRGAEGRSASSLLPRQSAAGRLRGAEPATLSGEIVTIGKRLSDNLTLTYETATTGAGNTVQLSYQLTRRLSLIGRAGTESTLDLVYGFAFD